MRPKPDKTEDSAVTDARFDLERAARRYAADPECRPMLIRCALSYAEALARAVERARRAK